MRYRVQGEHSLSRDRATADTDVISDHVNNDNRTHDGSYCPRLGPYWDL